MRKTMLAALICLLTAATAQAADLVWEYSQDDQAKILGFRIIFTDTAAPDIQYSHLVPDPAARRVVDIDHTLHLVPAHEYNFRCRAYNASGESGDSNTVGHTAPAWQPPQNRYPLAGNVNRPTEATVQ